MKKYQPSNGTEGQIFMAQWCDQCWKDRHAQDRPEKGCQILMRTMMYSTNDPEYPSEWVYIQDYRDAKCTAFLSYDEHAQQCQSRKKTRYTRREKFGQQRLFV